MTDIENILQHYGHWAHGGNIEAVAREWINLSFTADDVQRWLDVEVFDPDAAAKLRSVGVSPDDIRFPLHIPSGGYYGMVGYAYANGDISLEELLEKVKSWGGE